MRSGTPILLFGSFQLSRPFHYMDFIVFNPHSQIPGNVKGLSRKIFQDSRSDVRGSPYPQRRLIVEFASKVTVQSSRLQVMSIPCAVTLPGSVVHWG